MYSLNTAVQYSEPDPNFGSNSSSYSPTGPTEPEPTRPINRFPVHYVTGVGCPTGAVEYEFTEAQ